MDTSKNELYVEMYTHYRNWEANGESQIGYANLRGYLLRNLIIGCASCALGSSHHREILQDL